MRTTSVNRPTADNILKNIGSSDADDADDADDELLLNPTAFKIIRRPFMTIVRHTKPVLTTISLGLLFYGVK